RYRYRRRHGVPALDHGDNHGLREAMRGSLPLVYFYGVEEGWYLAARPVYIVGDDRASETFTVAVEADESLASDVLAMPDDIRRRYVTREVWQRQHQRAFRHRVLRAYNVSCTMCRLRRRELLEAAHIVPDSHPEGEPLISNGLSLCKLHHAAFDNNIIGIRPDRVVEVRRDVLHDADGPMLLHGLQELHRQPLQVLPRAYQNRPDAKFLEERYQLFRAAS
ncbi:MAG: HNH endonuclease, partial [Candidatus Dormibacteria bacterium]